MVSLLAVFVFSVLIASQFALAMTATVAASPPVPKALASTVQSEPLTQSTVLRRGAYENYELDAFSNNSTAVYAVRSSAPISVALMTAAQYNEFQNDPSDPISNSLTYVNGTDVQNSFPISTGQYFLVLFAYSSRAFVQFGYGVLPKTPFSYGPVSGPLASGIASFGVYNNSGVVTPYEVKTDEIVGLANIGALQTYSPGAIRHGVRVTGATLQLNAILTVADEGAALQKAYWVQDVPDFVTGAAQVAFGDEIWNSTDTNGYLSNQTVTSTNFQNGGFVSSSGDPNSGAPFAYDYLMDNATYALPLKFGLLMKETVLPGTGVLVQLGYRLLANGSAVTSPTNWFDNVTIHDQSVAAAYFDVSGNAGTPDGHYYDAELVFAGEGNLASAYFTALNATLGLFYQNGSSGTLSSFPTYYSFSGDTGEAADNLVVTYANGIASVEQGASPNYVYLGSGSAALDLDTMTVSMSTSAGSATTTATGTTASASQPVSTSVSSTGAVQLLPKPSGSLISAGPGSYVLLTAGTVVVAIIIAVLVMALALRRKTPEQDSGYTAGPDPSPLDVHLFR